MRCLKCGYDGTENVAGGNCYSCGAKLHQNGEQTVYYKGGGTGVTDSQLKQTVVQSGNPVELSDSIALKKTVVQGTSEIQSNDLQATVIQSKSEQWNSAATVKDGVSNVFNNSEDDDTDTQHEHYTPILVDGKLECPKCHYPLSSDSLTSCPNCMADFTGAEEDDSSEKDTDHAEKGFSGGTVDLGAISSEADKDDIMIECDNCKKQISATFKYCPYCAQEVVKKTVAFRRKRKKNDTQEPSSEMPSEELSEPQHLHCHLTILPDDDEKIEAFTQKFEGNNIILNRNNTEPENNSITSKEQAELIYDKGNWYIENKSYFGTTFLAVNRRLLIMPGDVIMLGDRRFIFGVDDSK